MHRWSCSRAIVRSWWRATTTCCSPSGCGCRSTCTHALETPAEGEQVRLPAAGRPAAGGVLGSGSCQEQQPCSTTARRIVIGTRCIAARAAAGAVRPRRPRRQDHRSDIGRHDRQPGLERHRVHGHQDQQDDRQRVPRQQRQPAHGDDVAGRPLRGHRRHARQQGVHHRHAHAAAGQGDSDGHRAGAPRVLARQPLVLPGQSGRRFDLGDRHAVAQQDQDDPGIRRAAQRHVPARRLEGLHRQLRRALGRASSTSGGTNC